jgi:hypothetical protein
MTLRFAAQWLLRALAATVILLPCVLAQAAPNSAIAGVFLSDEAVSECRH